MVRQRAHAADDGGRARCLLLLNDGRARYLGSFNKFLPPQKKTHFVKFSYFLIFSFSESHVPAPMDNFGRVGRELVASGLGCVIADGSLKGKAAK